MQETQQISRCKTHSELQNILVKPNKKPSLYCPKCLSESPIPAAPVSGSPSFRSARHLIINKASKQYFLQWSAQLLKILQQVQHSQSPLDHMTNFTYILSEIRSICRIPKMELSKFFRQVIEEQIGIFKGNQDYIRGIQVEKLGMELYLIDIYNMGIQDANKSIMVIISKFQKIVDQYCRKYKLQDCIALLQRLSFNGKFSKKIQQARQKLLSKYNKSIFYCPQNQEKPTNLINNGKSSPILKRISQLSQANSFNNQQQHQLANNPLIQSEALQKRQIFPSPPKPPRNEMITSFVTPFQAQRIPNRYMTPINITKQESERDTNLNQGLDLSRPKTDSEKVRSNQSTVSTNVRDVVESQYGYRVEKENEIMLGKIQRRDGQNQICKRNQNLPKPFESIDNNQNQFKRISKLHSLVQQLHTQNDKLKNCKNDIQKQSQKCNNKIYEISQLISLNNNKDKSIYQNNKLSQAQQKTLSILFSEYKSIHQLSKSLQCSLSQKTCQLTSLSSQLVSLQSQLDLQSQTHKQQKSQLCLQIAQLQQLLPSLHKKIEDLETEISRKQSEEKDKDGLVATMQKQMGELNDINKKIRAIVDKKDREVEDLQAKFRMEKEKFGEMERVAKDVEARVRENKIEYQRNIGKLNENILVLEQRLRNKQLECKCHHYEQQVKFKDNLLQENKIQLAKINEKLGLLLMKQQQKIKQSIDSRQIKKQQSPNCQPKLNEKDQNGNIGNQINMQLEQLLQIQKNKNTHSQQLIQSLIQLDRNKQETIDQLRKQLAQNTNSAQRFQQLASKERMLALKQTQLHQKQSSMLQKQSQLGNKQKIIKDQIQRLSSIQQLLSQKQAELNTIQQNASRNKQQQNSLADNYNESPQNQQKLQQLASTIQQLRQQNEQLLKCQQAITKLESRIEEAQHSYSHSHSHSHSSKTQKSEQEQQIGELEEMRKQLEELLKVEHSKITHLESLVRCLVEMDKHKQEHIDQIQRELNEKKRNIQELAYKHNEEIEKSKIQTEESGINTDQVKKQTEQRAFNTQQIIKQTQQMGINTQQNQNQQQLQQLQQKQSQLIKLKQQQAFIQDQLNRKQIQLDDKSKQIEDKIVEIQNLERNVEESKREMLELNTRMGEIIAENQRIGKQFEDMNQTIDRLNGELCQKHNLLQEQIKISQNLQQSLQKLQTQNTDLQKCQQALTILQNRIKQAEQQQMHNAQNLPSLQNISSLGSENEYELGEGEAETGDNVETRINTDSSQDIRIKLDDQRNRNKQAQQLAKYLVEIQKHKQDEIQRLGKLVQELTAQNQQLQSLNGSTQNDRQPLIQKPRKKNLVIQKIQPITINENSKNMGKNEQQFNQSIKLIDEAIQKIDESLIKLKELQFKKQQAQLPSQNLHQSTQRRETNKILLKQQKKKIKSSSKSKKNKIQQTQKPVDHKFYSQLTQSLQNQLEQAKKKLCTAYNRLSQKPKQPQPTKSKFKTQQNDQADQPNQNQNEHLSQRLHNLQKLVINLEEQIKNQSNSHSNSQENSSFDEQLMEDLINTQSKVRAKELKIREISKLFRQIVGKLEEKERSKYLEKIKEFNI